MHTRMTLTLQQSRTIKFKGLLDCYQISLSFDSESIHNFIAREFLVYLGNGSRCKSQSFCLAINLRLGVMLVWLLVYRGILRSKHPCSCCDDGWRPRWNCDFIETHVIASLTRVDFHEPRVSFAAILWPLNLFRLTPKAPRITRPLFYLESNKRCLLYWVGGSKYWIV
jgi:hypothetical protein